MQKRALVILGGLRVGDTFHTIPMFRDLFEKGYKVTWISGTYEQDAVRYISGLFNMEYILLSDGFPGDLNDRTRFIETAKSYPRTELIMKESDLVIDDINWSFDISGSAENYKQIPSDKIGIWQFPKPYIVVQLDSCSKWKRMDFMKEVNYPCQVVCVGKGDDIILDNCIDFRNKPISEVVSCIKHANLFVGIHSSMTCLSFYIPEVKAIACHFGDGLLEFSKYNPNMYDYKGTDPKELEKIIGERLCLV